MYNRVNSDNPGRSTDLNSNLDGSYFNSKFKSSTAMKYAKPSKSPLRERSTSPGPGA